MTNPRVNYQDNSVEFLLEEPLFKILPLMIGLWLNQIRAYKSSKPQGWYIKVYQNQEKDRQDASVKAKDENKTKTD